MFFGKLAEIAREYLRKGSQVYIEGNIRYEKYTDRNGIEKYSTDVVAYEMQMLGSSNHDENRQPASTCRQRLPNQQNTNQQQTSYQQNSQSAEAEFNDDILF